MDLSKAFDMIDHSQLLGKLYGYGIRRNELMWFKNYLRGRKQRDLLGTPRINPGSTYIYSVC